MIELARATALDLEEVSKFLRIAELTLSGLDSPSVPLMRQSGPSPRIAYIRLHDSR